MTVPSAAETGDPSSDEAPSSSIRAGGLHLGRRPDAPGWPPLDKIEVWTNPALAALVAHMDLRGEASLLLSDDAKLRHLNTQFRAKDRPTNILSFPDGTDGYLGDMAISLQRVTEEAKDQSKTFADHFAHLLVHGLLHLAGFDHETEADALIMEGLERDILSDIGIADPYADQEG